MKKIINEAQNIVPEMLDGFLAEHHQKIERVDDTYVVKQKDVKKQVSLISGGGSGHEPSHAGFVGDGMLQAAVLGQVFTSPTPDQIYEAIKAVDQGQGVVEIVKNYSGDIMNFEMAKELADMDDIKVAMVVVNDDVAVEDSTYTQGKRGVAGTILVHKILGSAARAGMSIEEIELLGNKVVENLKTVGVALGAATVPEVGKPGFILGEDEIEFGVGIHGEPGYQREKIKTSKELAEEMIRKILEHEALDSKEEYAVLVNGLGGTPLMEQYVFLNDCLTLLKGMDIKVTYTKVGSYMTSIDMAGVSLTLLKLEEGWKDRLEESVDTPSW